ncbi:MAG: hypothetical protein R3F62_19650 [Planctomycetota bacterium]
MALLRNTTLQALGAWLLAFSQVFWVVGCRQTTGGGGGSATTAPGATAGLNIGELVYQIMHHGYESKGEQAKADTLELNHSEFVGAINHILPSSVGQNLFPTLLDLLPLVDDGTVEAAIADVEAIVQDLVNDPATLDAVAELMSASGASSSSSFAEQRDTFVLLNRLLAYPEMDKLSQAIFHLIDQYDGVDQYGQPNGERNLFRELQGTLSRVLQTSSVPQGSSTSITQGLGDLADALLAEKPMKGFPNLGAPAWAVRLDVHGNPQVLADPASGMLPAPFVDADADGVADVNAAGDPVDAGGQAIEIPAFGNEGARDSYGRALASGGGLYYAYFDAKRTLLSELLLVAGELFKKDLGADSMAILDKLSPRVMHDNGTPADPTDDYETLSADCPLLDLTHAQFELIKHTPLADLLKGIAVVIKNDPDQFGEIVDTLIVALKQAGNAASATSTTPAGGGKQLLDDLLPLLQDTLRPNGQQTSTMRDLLSAFNSQQAQLQTLPASFANMMKYHDYKNRVLADANNKSVMQRLLEMMERADKCNAPFAGNMADFYLRAMAGDQRLLGITISINTIERLLDVSILRRLLCSGIRADDVLALKDFNQSGALDAMKPIAKVFSNRNQIPLLKNIMLGLGKHYETVMRPTEPTAVALLESGAVEKLFSVIDDMTTVQVPGRNDVVADVLADVLSEVMLTSTPVFDRRGVQKPTLMHLLMEPLDTLSQRAQASGASPLLDKVMSGLGEVLFATYVDDNGTPGDASDDVERWRYDCLKNELGRAIEFLADTLPSTAADRARWAAESQADIEELILSRELVLVIDVMSAITASPEKQVIHAALANLFTPTPTASDDVFGAICVLGAGLINHKKQSAPNPINDQALQQVLHFVGVQLDPALDRFSGIGRLALRIIGADDGLLLLKIARNAIDMGPNGTDEPPVAVLQRIVGDVGAAGNTGPTTGDSLQTQLQGMLDFMRDSVEGLPAFIQRIKNRTVNRAA